MAPQVSGTFSKVAKPPDGESWVWLSQELMCSPAWCGMSMHCRKLIDFLCVEHMHHAGRENGSLIATYDQLEAAGLGRRFISGAIREAEARGLVRVERGGKRNQVVNHLNRYELTWLPTKRVGPDRIPYWTKPSNDWKQVTDRTISKFHTQEKVRGKQKSGAPMVNSISAPVVNFPGAR